MNKLLESLKNLKDKWLGLSNTKKIVIAILAVAVIVAASVATTSLTSTKYGVLFSQMDSTDAATVIAKLKTDKIAYKVDSTTNTISVPEANVDELRLTYAPLIKDGSTGFELFDSSSSQLGMTDQQFNVTYQRALEGEIERTIKSFPQVDDARVELVMPDDSVFVTDSSPATASVFLKLKNGETLAPSQVKAIIALISGAVKNLPAANVQVVDANMKLLSAGLSASTDSSTGDDTDVSDTTAARSSIEDKQETELQGKVLDQLEPIYGKDKVKVQVHADMNFNAIQQDSTVEKDPVVVSEHETNTVTPDGNTSTSGSPVSNNNSSNQIVNSNSTSGAATSTDVTKNYDTSKTETKTVTSPGDINRLTVSVVVDGKVSNLTQASINNIVSQAVGINPQRGDTVSIEGLQFDTSLQTAALKAQADMTAAQQLQQKNDFIRNIIIGGVIGALAIAGLVIFLVKRRKNNEEYEDDEEGLDELIGDDIQGTKPVKYAPIEFEGHNEKSHMEKEIKNYATNKPEQVADVVKSWISEDER